MEEIIEQYGDSFIAMLTGAGWLAVVLKMILTNGWINDAIILWIKSITG